MPSDLKKKRAQAKKEAAKKKDAPRKKKEETPTENGHENHVNGDAVNGAGKGFHHCGKLCIISKAVLYKKESQHTMWKQFLGKLCLGRIRSMTFKILQNY